VIFPPAASGVPTPPQPPGKHAATPAPTSLTVPVFRGCDRCGYSKDGQPLAKALFQIETTGGSLYFCGHHFRAHSDAILSLGYPVREVHLWRLNPIREWDRLNRA